MTITKQTLMLYFIMSNFIIIATQTDKVETIFTNIFEKNKWGSKESPSGPGSTIARTMAIREYLPKLIKELNIKKIIDAPCGDFNWLKLLIHNLDFDLYIGIDIVEKLINKNIKKFGNEKIKFSKLDIINEPIPQADLILCRDCVQHLPYADIISVLRNFKKSGSTYLLMTTFTKDRAFTDIKLGGWRPINFQNPPFSLVKPIQILNEKYPAEKYNDKSLALWKLSDINLD